MSLKFLWAFLEITHTMSILRDYPHYCESYYFFTRAQNFRANQYNLKKSEKRCPCLILISFFHCNKGVYIFEFSKVALATSLVKGCSHRECNFGQHKNNFENLCLEISNGDVIKMFGNKYGDVIKRSKISF